MSYNNIYYPPSDIVFDRMVALDFLKLDNNQITGWKTLKAINEAVNLQVKFLTLDHFVAVGAPEAGLVENHAVSLAPLHRID